MSRAAVPVITAAAAKRYPDVPRKPALGDHGDRATGRRSGIMVSRGTTAEMTMSRPSLINGSRRAGSTAPHAEPV
ncbi:MAG: hypothetical protein WAJ95_10685, partial [Desulfobacterales bacterium]